MCFAWVFFYMGGTKRELINMATSQPQVPTPLNVENVINDVKVLGECIIIVQKLQSCAARNRLDQTAFPPPCPTLEEVEVIKTRLDDSGTFNAMAEFARGTSTRAKALLEPMRSPVLASYVDEPYIHKAIAIMQKILDNFKNAHPDVSNAPQDVQCADAFFGTLDVITQHYLHRLRQNMEAITKGKTETTPGPETKEDIIEVGDHFAIFDPFLQPHDQNVRDALNTCTTRGQLNQTIDAFILTHPDTLQEVYPDTDPATRTRLFKEQFIKFAQLLVAWKISPLHEAIVAGNDVVEKAESPIGEKIRPRVVAPG